MPGGGWTLFHWMSHYEPRRWGSSSHSRQEPRDSETHQGLLLISGEAVAAAKSLQLWPTLCDPIDSSLPGSPVPGILQARILEWVAISFSNAWEWKVKVKSLSRVQLFVTPWTVAYQAPLSTGFSRQEDWSGVPLPSPISGEASIQILCLFGSKPSVLSRLSQPCGRENPEVNHLANHHQLCYWPQPAPSLATPKCKVPCEGEHFLWMATSNYISE